MRLFIFTLYILQIEISRENYENSEIKREVTSFQIYPDTDPALLAKEKCSLKYDWCVVLAEASIQRKKSELFGTPLDDWKWNQYCRFLNSSFE